MTRRVISAGPYTEDATDAADDADDAAGAAGVSLRSQGAGTADGFFMKIDQHGVIRHILHLRGPKANAITVGGAR